MWEVPHRLARDGATDAGWRHRCHFTLDARSWLVLRGKFARKFSVHAPPPSCLLVVGPGRGVARGCNGLRPAGTSHESRPPPHFSSCDLTPWRVSSPAGLPDFAGLVWRLTAVEEKNLFIQPLDLMHPPPRPDAARPPNRQERSPSLTPPSSSLGLLALRGLPRLLVPGVVQGSKTLLRPPISLGHSITSRLSPCPASSCL
jgi:hypothetical protein